jgi:hypothetical protein
MFSPPPIGLMSLLEFPDGLKDTVGTGMRKRVGVASGSAASVWQGAPCGRIDLRHLERWANEAHAQLPADECK